MVLVELLGLGVAPEVCKNGAEVADGVVVGSALLNVLKTEGPAGAGRYLGTLRAGMDGVAD